MPKGGHKSCPWRGKIVQGGEKFSRAQAQRILPPPLPLTNCSSTPLALSVPILSNLLFQMREIYGMHAFKAAITHNQNPTRHLGVERVKLNDQTKHIFRWIVAFTFAEKFYCNWHYKLQTTKYSQLVIKNHTCSQIQDDLGTQLQCNKLNVCPFLTGYNLTNIKICKFIIVVWKNSLHLN